MASTRNISVPAERREGLVEATPARRQLRHFIAEMVEPSLPRSTAERLDQLIDRFGRVEFSSGYLTCAKEQR